MVGGRKLSDCCTLVLRLPVNQARSAEWHVRLWLSGFLDSGKCVFSPGIIGWRSHHALKMALRPGKEGQGALRVVYEVGRSRATCPAWTRRCNNNGPGCSNFLDRCASHRSTMRRCRPNIPQGGISTNTCYDHHWFGCQFSY